ncbi:LacI family DNA-binding transcriptional regulator [Massilia niastensis]|uniref:LacI family DNA-binding transcriptional regulator n=1 Tax=Massilia niastensis TaxID=544911 RepID=UPI0003A2B356|nr:LacI family DNA-binding transcriptional regulator [Massilia niastensis]
MSENPSATAAPQETVRRRRRHGGLTLRDVAKLAGVAPITASRALNTPDAVSPEILARVRDAVERTGYVPNILAGGLASRQTRLVAAVVPTISSPVFPEMIEALTNALAAAGYQLMLGQSGYADSREDELLEAIIGRRADGVVLTGVSRSPLARRRLIASGIPVVETWDYTPTPIDMLVGFSHTKLGSAVAAYLHGRGRRRVAVIGAGDERARQRTNAFIQTAQALKMAGPGGQVPTFHVPAPTTVGLGRSGLRALLAEHPDIDAVFCSSDMLAMGVLHEAQAQGIAIPDRLGVIGMGDQGFSRDVHPALTTVRIDGNVIGETAAHFILERIAGRQVADPVRDIGFTIVERATI